jgi:hypothetical protein
MTATGALARAAQRAHDARWERAYARVDAVYPEVRITPWPPCGTGWLSGHALGAEPEALAELVAHETQVIRTDWRAEPRPYVAATWALLHYGFYAAFALAGPYLRGLMPDLEPDGFAMRPSHGPGHPMIEVALDPRGWTDVATVGADAGRAELRRVHVALVAPVFDAGRVAARRSPVALWRAAADALAGALWRVGERLGDERGAAAEAALVLGDRPGGTGPISPYAGGANFRELTLPSGAQRLTRERNDCCFAYTLGTPDPCITCPRLDDVERVRLLADGKA